MEKKITILGVWKEGWEITMKNLLSILGAVVLYVLTIWIPYLNVGTTIAMTTIPIELSKGHVISPLFIFDAKYRRYMGEYFMLIGLMIMALIPAYLFLLIPGIVISYAWSLAIYLLLDKKMAPGEAIVKSNEATYGYKWTIFICTLAIYVAIGVVVGIANAINNVFGSIVNIILMIVAMPFIFACYAVIYRNLTAEEQPAANLSGSTAETTEPAAGE